MQSPFVELKVTGADAIFSDPVFRLGGENCSYLVPTYEALKQVLKSVYWKPTFDWYVDDVRIMNKIHMYSRGVRPMHYQNDGNDLSYHTYLSDVEYRIRAHFEWNENHPALVGDRNLGKHMNRFEDALSAGGRRDVFLGRRECQAFAEPCAFDAGTGAYDNQNKPHDFGVMLHGFTYADEAYSPETRGKLTVRLWRPVMRNGIIHFIRPQECVMTKVICDMPVKQFGLAKADVSKKVGVSK